MLDDADHRRFFQEAIGGEHGAHMAQAASERFYTAQVIWDETMAEVASTWVVKRAGRQLLVVAGNGHCHRSAIVRRFERRLPELRGLAILVKSAEGQLPEHAPADFVVTLD